MNGIKTIGLTGGIACGKSTVAKLLIQNGIKVINADDLAHQAVEPDGPAYLNVVKEFGSDIIKVDGQIDRRQLGEIVFADPTSRKRLESLIHPVVLTDVKREIEQAKENRLSLLVFEIQLLFEVGWESLFDRVWVVSASADEQLKRLQQRDHLTAERAIARIKTQLPLAYKEKKADAVIYNNKGLPELQAQIQRLIKTVE